MQFQLRLRIALDQGNVGIDSSCLRSSLSRERRWMGKNEFKLLQIAPAELQDLRQHPLFCERLLNAMTNAYNCCENAQNPPFSKALQPPTVGYGLRSD